MFNIVGTIVASMLEADKFLAQNGANWVLADGALAPDGSDYSSLIGSNVPDLRGVFIRGKNYTRDPNSGNAEGDLVLGTFQAFALAAHAHQYVQMIGDDSVDGVDSTVRHSGDHHNEERQTGIFGGAEVRPNCVTVNYFVCVQSLKDG